MRPRSGDAVCPAANPGKEHPRFTGLLSLCAAYGPAPGIGRQRLERPLAFLLSSTVTFCIDLFELDNLPALFTALNIHGLSHSQFFLPLDNYENVKDIHWLIY